MFRVLFGVLLSTLHGGRNSLWSLSDGGITYEAYLQNGAFFLNRQLNSSNSSARWVGVGIPATIPLNRWSLAGLELSPNGSSISAFFGASRLTEPIEVSLSSSATLDVGKYNTSTVSDYQNALEGLVTSVYPIPAASLAYREIAYVWTAVSGALSVFESPSVLPMVISGSSASPMLRFDSEVIPVGSFDGLWLGKLSASSVGLQIAFDQVRITADSTGPNALILITDFAVVLPLAVSLWCFYPILSRRFSAGWSRSF